MSNRENQDRKAGSFSLITIAVIALAICAAALMLMPAHAGSDAATESAKVSATATTGYVPAQYVNQAKEIEPAPKMYY